jgi:hypothetical protein
MFEINLKEKWAGRERNWNKIPTEFKDILAIVYQIKYKNVQS